MGPGRLRKHRGFRSGFHGGRRAGRDGDRHEQSSARPSDTVVTNASGNFVKDRLLPGRYDVKAELTGFKAQVVPRVVVNVDSQTQLSLRLETGDLTETVTVEATEGQLLKTDRADVATVVREKQLTELPVLDRNFTKFLLLTPGTQQQTWQHAASENPQGSTQTMVNGQTFSGTGWQLDGTDNRDVILGIVVVNSTLESIGESKITSQNYDAEFGQAVAGVVSVQTKSGHERVPRQRVRVRAEGQVPGPQPVHPAGHPEPRHGKVLPETKKDQFGGSIGGPIQKNKWFFFGDYQGSRNTVGGSQLLTCPRPRPAPATCRPMASTSTTRSPAIPASASSSRATSSPPTACRPRPRTS